MRISWQDEVHIAAEAAWTASDRIRPLRLKSIWTLNGDFWRREGATLARLQEQLTGPAAYVAPDLTRFFRAIV
jgi:hypothetical protein